VPNSTLTSRDLILIETRYANKLQNLIDEMEKNEKTIRHLKYQIDNIQKSLKDNPSFDDSKNLIGSLNAVQINFDVLFFSLLLVIFCHY
jgi:hypothetical protein